MSRAQQTSTVEQNGGGVISPIAGGKNRIINGDFSVDQRASGAAKTIVNSGSSYPGVDRWQMGVSSSVVATTQQITSDAPVGFGYSNKITFTTGQSIVSGSNSIMWQWAEGLTTSDLNWGTANGQTCTLSFWAKSSVTGNHAVQIYTGYSYVTTYNITAANTWQKFSIVIPPLTVGGSKPVDNTASISVGFVWGAGSSLQTTANTWVNGYYTTVAGAAAPAATSGATWLIAGVQFEVGSVATPFSKAGGTVQGELSLCQRYYYRTPSGTNIFLGSGNAYSGTGAAFLINPPVTMRTTPSSAVDYGNLVITDNVNTGLSVSLLTLNTSVSNAASVYLAANVSGATQFREYWLTAASSGAGYIGFSAEL